MTTARSRRSAWNSLWKKSRRGRASSTQAMSLETLEVRVLPAAVNVTAAADGYARDANRDNVFTVLDTIGNNLLVRSTTGTNTGYERSMLEFDLSTISTALTVDSATLVLNVSQFTKSGTVFPKVDVYGYTGDGVIDLADASAAATLVGTATVNALGELRINLDANFVRSQGAGFIGLRLQNPTLNGPISVFSALESPAADPVLELDLSLNLPDREFDIDEQRPNGTIVGNVNIGNVATYAIDPATDPLGVFNINSSTGLITVAKSNQLKFSLQQQYVLKIGVALPDGTTGEFNVTINVKNVFGPNNPPVVTPAQFSIEEFSPLGTVVGKVSAVDPDSADPLQFSITSGNIGNAFKINSKTGEITVNNQSVLSRRNTPSILLEVSVIDTRDPRYTRKARVEVFLTPRAQAAVAALPNSVQILPTQDGEVRDLNNDGIYESLNAISDSIQIKGPTANRRAVLEFNLGAVGTSKVVKSAYLTIYVNGNVGNNIPVSVYGYFGNGFVSTQDANAGTVIATRNFNITSPGDLKAYTIELDRALIQQVVANGGTLGLVLRNNVNANSISIDSSEGPGNLGNNAARRPSLNLILDDLADDAVFVNTTNQALTVARSNGSAFTTLAASALRQGVTFSELLTGDFNGDGRLDIAGRNSANGQVLVALAAANQFVTGAAWTAFSTETTFSDLVVGDFNGDGKDDIAGRSKQGQLVVAVSAGNKFNNSVFETLPSAPSDLRTLTNVRVGDFNGDGRDDLMGIVATTGQVVVSISSGTGFTSSVWGVAQVGATEINVGDFNGDGRDDVLTRQGNSLVVLQSSGTGFSNVTFYNNVAVAPYIGFRMGDFNGDGLDDLVGFTGTGAMTLFRSTGAGFTALGGGTLPVPALNLSPADIVVGDFNRDGRSDILVRNTVTTTVNNITTSTQQLFVSLGASLGGQFSSSLWGTINGAGPFMLLGVGNY